MPLALHAHSAAPAAATAAARAPATGSPAQPQHVAVQRRRRCSPRAAPAAEPAAQTRRKAAARPSRRELLAGALRFGVAGAALSNSVDDIAEVAALPRSLTSAAVAAAEGPLSPRAAGARTAAREAFEVHMPLPLKPISPHVPLAGRDGPTPTLRPQDVAPQVCMQCLRVNGRVLWPLVRKVGPPWPVCCSACPCSCLAHTDMPHRAPVPCPPLLQAAAPTAQDGQVDVPSHARRLLLCGAAVNAFPFQAVLQPNRADVVFMQLADVAADVGADRLMSALPYGALPICLLLWGSQIWGCLRPAASQAQRPALVLA